MFVKLDTRQSVSAYIRLALCCLGPAQHEHNFRGSISNSALHSQRSEATHGIDASGSWPGDTRIIVGAPSNGNDWTPQGLPITVAGPVVVGGKNREGGWQW